MCACMQAFLNLFHIAPILQPHFLLTKTSLVGSLMYRLEGRVYVTTDKPNSTFFRENMLIVILLNHIDIKYLVLDNLKVPKF